MVRVTVYVPAVGSTVTVYFPEEMDWPFETGPEEEVTVTEVPELLVHDITPLPLICRVAVFDPDCVVTMTEMPEFSAQLDTPVTPEDVPERLIAVPLVVGQAGV